MTGDMGELATSTVSLGAQRSPTPELPAIYTTLEVIVAVVAVVGNAMVIHVFRRDRRLRRRTNYYIVSLAIADLLVGLLGIPFAILASVGLPQDLHACLFTVSLLVMLCTISIFCLVAVSVDRYWAILHPMCYSRNVRTRTAIACHPVLVNSLWGRHGAGKSASRLISATQPVAPRPRTYTMRVCSYILPFFVLLWLPYICARVGGRGGGRSGGRSGSRSASRSGGGTAGFKGHFNSNSATNYHISARHAHFSYHPPQNINYMCRHCAAPVAYPVYHAPLPTYVYKYRESGSRYGDLLTGLALYNLGRASSHNTPYNNYYHKQSVSDECSMQVVDRKHFEETPVPCLMMSTFLERAAAEPDGPQLNQLDITSPQIDVHNYINATGEPIEVTSEHECVLWHNSTMKKERSKVPCVLLERYAETLKPSGVPVYIWLPVLLATCVAITICCQCFCKKKVDRKEEAPLNETTVLGYSSYVP